MITTVSPSFILLSSCAFMQQARGSARAAASKDKERGYRIYAELLTAICRNGQVFCKSAVIMKA